MARVLGSAPAKSILFGEHYAVYGARGVACGITPRNSISFEAHGQDGGFSYETKIGKMEISAQGKVSCAQALLPAAEAYRRSVEKWPDARKLKIHARQEKVWPIKGVGNSASLAAAMAAGIAKCAGKTADARECFEVAQQSDKVAHGGSPSGIDAAAVSYGGAVVARKKFGAEITYDFSNVKIGKMNGWKFLLVDTDAGKGKANTAEQIAKFARAHKAGKKPEAMTDLERQAVCSEYGALVEDAIGALARGNMGRVAECMNQNHALLRKGDVSCAGIEKAVSGALKAGASGAKLSGAGGEGGAVLVLAEDGKIPGIGKALLKAGFSTHEFTISKDGARAEKA